MVDKKYCMSSYLMYRRIHDHTKSFSETLKPRLFEVDFERESVFSSEDLEQKLRSQMQAACSDGKAVLALSGGIDSAILASMMPKGSMTYTFRCIVPGMHVTDESPQAKLYAKNNGLQNKTIDVYWEDFEKYAPILMKHKGAPIHSIEVQIYKAALHAKAAGYKRIVFGESADLNYGGLSSLLSKNLTVGDMLDRYAYILPYHVLRESEMVIEPIAKHARIGFVDVHEFCRTDFFLEAMGSYTNACETAGLEVVMPYSRTWMGIPLDLERVRRGENKYLIREIFQRSYEGFTAPPKTPMPRPMNEWLKNWNGPKRPEFWENCVDERMTGDQRWLLWALERFLNMLEEDNAL